MESILVIMATYNGASYLCEQLDSILSQEKVNVSILVRDDGSSDETIQILERYQQEGKLRWYTGEHLNVQKGYFDLMKKASLCGAEYIAFADQDDVWDKDKLKIAIDQLGQFPSNVPALYYCGQRIVDEKLKLISEHKLNEKRNYLTRFLLSDFAGCTGVFNYALLKEVIRYEPDYMLMHDTWILKICLCIGGNLYVDSQPHMSYRQHSNNTLGLGRGIRAALKQVKQYIFVYDVERQMRELIAGYGNNMVDEYKKLAVMVCEYKRNANYKKQLLNSKSINFHNRGLNLTYYLKVKMNKL